VNTNIFQAEVNKLPEPMTREFDLGGTLNVKYHLWNKFGPSMFSPDKSTSLDIVYMLLSEWLAPVGGAWA